MAGRRDLERAPSRVLTADLGEIARVLHRGRPASGPRASELATAGEVLDRVGERCGDEHLDAGDDRRLGPVLRRDDRTDRAPASRREELREHAADRTDLAGERQLAQEERAFDRLDRDEPERRERRDCDREIERAPGLPQIAGGEVDDDAVLVEEDAELRERRADAHATLADARFGEADEIEHRRSARRLDLDADEVGVDAEQGGGEGGCEHGRLVCDARAEAGAGKFRGDSPCGGGDRVATGWRSPGAGDLRAPASAIAANGDRQLG